MGKSVSHLSFTCRQLTTQVATEHMDKFTIENRLKSGKLSLAEIDEGAGDIWHSFACPVNADGTKVINFAACRNCRKVFKIRNDDGRHLGTSNLRSHLSKCAEVSSSDKIIPSTKITHFFMNSRQRMTVNEKNELKDCLVNYVVEGMNSFNSIEQQSLINLVQFGVKIGQSYPKGFNMSAEWIGRRTVARAMADNYAIMKEEIKLKIQSTSSIALTTDLWTDNVRKRSYLDVSAVYLDSPDATSFTRIGLACRVFPDVPHTGEHIKTQITSVLREFGLSDETPITSDSGSNILKALSDNVNFVCFCHRFHTCFTDAMKATIQEDSDLRLLIDDMRALQGYVSHAGGINHQLPITIKSACLTRGWEDIIQLFHAFDESFDTLNDLLSKKELQHKLPRNRTLISLVQNWIAPLRQIFRELETSKRPALHMVLVAYYKVEKYCESASNSHPCLRILAKYLWSAMEKKYWTSTTTTHMIAVFLHPNLKSLSMIANSSSTKSTWLKSVRQDIESGIVKLANDLPINSCAHPSQSQSSPQNKKAKLHDDGEKTDGFFDDMFEVDAKTLTPERERTVEDEINDYKIMTVQVKHTNPLDFWKENSDRFPILNQLSRQIFIIQASSAESERHFSCAGNIVTEKRGSLDGETVEMLVLLKTNKRT